MKIIVSTCDKYNWILPVFFHFYKKAWPGNTNKTDVITEKEKVSFGNSVFYTGGNPGLLGSSTISDNQR